MIGQLLSFAAVVLLASGCASTNVNPPVPKAHTGYVDVYAEPAMAISWDVLHAKPGSDIFKRAFSHVKAVEDGMLRIAFPPGRHLLRVNVLNHVITDPADIEVEVVDGKITPVCVKFVAGQSLSVPAKDASSGGSVYRRQGRGSKISLYAASEYSISATAGESRAYQPKGH